MMVGLIGINSDSNSSIMIPTIESITMPISSWFHLKLPENAKIFLTDIGISGEKTNLREEYKVQKEIWKKAFKNMYKI